MYRLRLILSIFVVCLLLANVLPVAAQTPTPERLAALDAYVQKAMADWQVPGLSIAVVQRDQVVLAKGYGVREVGRPDPVDENTLFAVGSTTKAFTAASLGLLVDEGKLQWDDLVTQSVPTFRLSDPWVTGHFTVRDALSARSGLGQVDALWTVFDYPRDELVRRLQYAPLSGYRARFNYQNLMYVVAGNVLENVSGTKWPDFAQSRLLTPLGMSRSTVSVTPLVGNPNVASPHAPGASGPVPIRIRMEDTLRNVESIGPAGTLRSTARDMAQWVRLWLNGGTVDGKQLLSQKTAAEMVTPQTIIRPDDQPWGTIYAFSPLAAYGFGWFLSDYRGHKFVDHLGNVEGTTAEVAWLPDDHIGVVVLSNADINLAPPAIALKVVDLLLGFPETDWSAHYRDAWAKVMAGASASGAPQLPADSTSKPSLALADYTGAFENALWGPLEVVRAGESLAVRTSNGRVVGTLIHWNADTFEVEGPGLRQGGSLPLLTFAVVPPGRVDRFEIVGLGAFDRIAAPSAR